MNNLKIFDNVYPHIKPLAEKLMEAAINEGATIKEFSLALNRLGLMEKQIIEQTLLSKMKSDAKSDF